jgi:4,5-DOPA dioxygenase extradiol
VPLAFVPSDPPAKQFALGAALASLAEDGVLVLGSGSITHNLRRVFGGGGLHPDKARPEIPESAAFRRWFAERSAARDWEALFAYRGQAPHAVDMHPTDEHLLPWYVAAGAGGRDDAAEAHPRQRDDGQPRHGRLCLRPAREPPRRGARPGRSYMNMRGTQSTIAGT